MDALGIYGGIDFLRAMSLGEKLPIGRRVVVIGGGNVAFDVSRSAVRYADDDSERLVARQTETDISRVALRQEAVREVHLACLESREEMPADEVEIVEGEEEGIIRHNRLGPKEFLFREENGQKVVAGVRFRRVVSVFDANRRFAPVYDDSETVDVEADTVLLSVGQMADLSFLGDVSRLQVDPETCETGTPGVFAAGDVAYGARLMIDAIASGKKAARGVYRFLTGREIPSRKRNCMSRLKTTNARPVTKVGCVRTSRSHRPRRGLPIPSAWSKPDIPRCRPRARRAAAWIAASTPSSTVRSASCAVGVWMSVPPCA